MGDTCARCGTVIEDTDTVAFMHGEAAARQMRAPGSCARRTRGTGRQEGARSSRAVKRPRRDDAAPPTPTSNRERIVALEEHIERLEEVVNLQQRNLDVQLQRIALQTELDTIRAAWTKTRPVPKAK
jgi:hypothetical protein